MTEATEPNEGPLAELRRIVESTPNEVDFAAIANHVVPRPFEMNLEPDGNAELRNLLNDAYEKLNAARDILGYRSDDNPVEKRGRLQEIDDLNSAARAILHVRDDYPERNRMDDLHAHLRAMEERDPVSEALYYVGSSHAATVYEMLPCTVAKLVAKAEELRWCQEFDAELATYLSRVGFATHDGIQNAALAEHIKRGMWITWGAESWFEQVSAVFGTHAITVGGFRVRLGMVHVVIDDTMMEHFGDVGRSRPVDHPTLDRVLAEHPDRAVRLRERSAVDEHLTRAAILAAEVSAV